MKKSSKDFTHHSYIELRGVDSSSTEELKKIYRLLALINNLGRTLDTKIVVDVRGGAVRPPEQDDKAPVFVYLDAYPEAGKRINPTRRPPRTLFGQQISPGSRPLEEIYLAEGMPIKSPENFIVGWRLGKTLYIYPGTLGGISDYENTKILNHILYCALPYALECKSDRDAFDVWFKKYDILRKNYADKLRESKSRKISTASLSNFLFKSLTERLKERQIDLKEVRDKGKTEKIKYFKLLSKLADLEERLEIAKTKSENYNSGLEFEKILGMDLVGTVRIKQVEGKDYIIIINTQRIFQVPFGDETKKFDIGEFEIIIDPSVTSHMAIKFYQNRYPGPYFHAHANNTGTCFGTTDRGLNKDLDMLIQNLDMAALVHVILTFLVKEETEPKHRDQQRSRGFYQPSLDNVYINDEDRDKEKAEFIRLHQAEILKRLRDSLMPQINTVRAEIKSSQDKRVAYYFAGKEIELTIENIETKINGIDKHVSSEIYNLLSDPDVFELEVTESQIHIYFKSSELILNSYERMIGYILKIEIDQPPEIIFPSDKEINQSHSLIQGKMTDTIKDVMPGDKESLDIDLARAQFQGSAFGLLNIAKRIIQKGFCQNMKQIPMQWGPFGSGPVG